MPVRPAKRRRRETDPPIYGNFQRYYHIRNPLPSAADEDPSNGAHPALAVDGRVSAMLRYLANHYAASKSGGDVRVLDVGCNSGKVTIEMAQMLPRLWRRESQLGGWETNVEVVGVDIDPTLIKQARAAADVARSRCRPEHLGGAVGEGVDIKPDSLPPESVYFPSVFPSLYGCIPADDSRDSETDLRQHHHLSPPNLTLLTANFVDPHASVASHPLLTTRFHLTLALSITKWIHIQFGDAGLLKFLARIAHTLLAGGLLFLERQEWTSYASAKNLDPTIRGKIRRLQLRPGGDFDWWLETFGLELEGEAGQGRGVGFERPLQVFRRVDAEDGLIGYWARTSVDELQMVPWVARSALSGNGPSIRDRSEK